jgi:protein TonB
MTEAYQTIVTMNSFPSWPEQRGKARGFPLRPLAWSLALHALLLAALAPQFAREAAGIAPALPLLARLAVPNAPEPVAVPPKVVSPPAARAAPVPRAVPPAPTFEPIEAKSPTSAAPAQEAPVPAAQAAAAVSQAAAVAVGGERVERSAAQPATSALAVRTEAAGPDAAGLRQFRLALAGEARRHKRYPPAARRAGLAGVAEVRVTIAAGGGVRDTALGRSSGHAVLDEAALEMLGRAVARAEVPAALRGQSFSVLLPVVFEVED